MKTTILDLIDFEKVDILLEGFNKMTGFVTAILDLEGNVLSKSGWRQICTEFHRVNPEASKKCTISDTVLANKLAEGESFHFYKCLNGLVDVAVPVIIKGEHIANLFSGQFFFEEPDPVFFKKQAKKYGFDENIYLNALEKVPVVSKEKVQTAMEFLLNMTQLISDMTLQKLEQMELSEALIESERYTRTLFSESTIGLALTSMNGQLVDVNPAYCKIIGRSFDETLKLTYWELTTEKYKEQELLQLKNLEQTGYYGPYEKEYIHKDGHLVPVRLQGKIIEREGKKYIWSSVEDISEKKIFETNILASENKFRALVEQSLTGIYIFEKERFIYVNSRFSEIFGYSEQEIISKLKPTDVIIPEERTEAKDNINKRLSGQIKSIRYRARGKHKDNRELWVEIHGTHIELDGKDVITGTVLDITERILAENHLLESENQFRAAFEQSASGMCMTSLDGVLIKVNEPFSSMLGYPEEKLLGKHFNDFTFQEDLNIGKEFVQDMLNGKANNGSFEKRYIQSNGEILWTNINSSLIKDASGNPIRFITQIENITKRKKAAELLQESEERFSKAFRSSPVGITITNQSSGKFIEVNKSWSSIYGYTEKEAIGNTPVGLSMINDEAHQQIIGELKTKGTLTNVELLLRNKSGEDRTILFSSENIEIGGEACILSTGIDNTDRKRAMEALKDSEEKFKDIFESANVGKSITFQTGEMDANEAFCKMLGYNREELKYKRWQEITPAEEIPIIQKALEPLFNGEKDTARFEKRYICKNGTHTWADISITIRRDENDKPLYLIATIIDINERRQLEEERRNLEELFSNAFHLGPAGMTITRISDGKFIDANESFCNLFEINRDEVIGHTSTELNLWTPEERKILMQQQLETGGLYNFEMHAHTKSGQPINLLISSKQIEIGSEACLITTIIDNTKRRQAEEEIKRNQELIEEAQRIGKVGGWEFNIDILETTWTEEVFRIHEIDRSVKTTVESGINFYTPESRPIIEQAVNRAIDFGEPFDVELEIITAKGNLRSVRAKGKADLENRRVLGFFQDITESKQAEKDLKESKFFFEQLFIQSSTSTQLLDSEGWCLKINPKLTELFGVNPEDIEGKKYNILHDGEIIRTGVINHLNRVFENKETVKWEVNFDLQHASETTGVQISKPEKRWFQNLAYPILNAEGKLSYVIVQHEDITERKQAEVALAESEERFRRAVVLAPNPMMIHNEDDQVLQISAGWTKYSGYTIEDIPTIGDWTKKAYGDGGDVVHDYIDKLYEINKPTADNEWIIKSKSGENRVWEFFSTPLGEFNDEKKLLLSIGFDITDRKKAEEDLRISEEKFSKAFHNSPDILILTSIDDGRILDVNDTMEKLTGYNYQETIGKSTIELHIWANPDDRVRYVDMLLRDRIVRDMRVALRIKSGQIMDFSLSGEIISLQNKNYILGTLRDITEQKRMEEEILKSRKTLEAAFASMTDAIFIADAEGNYIDFNDAFITFHRFKNREECEKALTEKSEFMRVFDENDEKVPMEMWAVPRALRGETMINEEVTLHRKDIGITWHGSYSFSPIYDVDQTIIGSVVVARDITERKLAEENLNISNQTIRNIIDYSPSLIYLFDFDGKFITGNKYFEEFIGFPMKDFVGKSRELFFTTEISNMHRNNDLIVINSKQPLYLEEENMETDGKHYYLSVKFPLIDSNGKVYAVGGISTDISDRKKAEEKIKQINEELEHRVFERTKQLQTANKELESFSYSISHDLRAPLRAIYGFSQILASRHRDSLNEEGKNYMDYVLDASVRMEQLINDLLNYSRLGKNYLSFHPIPLNEVFDDIISDYKTELSNVGGKLILSNDLPTIIGDESLFNQIFSNLIGNSIKYRRIDIPLKITIQCEENNENYIIKVADNGIGISEKYWEKIFDVFQRLHSEKSYPGTGIGLANVKKAVTLLGGSIRVESEIESGSTFIIKFTGIKS